MIGWQDWSYSVCAWLFALALWPTVRNPFSHVPRLGSGLTAALVAVTAATHASLGMWNAALACVVLALFWWFIWWRRGDPVEAAERRKKFVLKKMMSRTGEEGR